MENDGGKPKNCFPKDFRPGGKPVEGLVLVTRGNSNYVVLGVDAYDRRVWARAEDGSTAWLECGNAQEIHEAHREEPVDVVCVCPSKGEGFTFEPDLGLWVHAECRKPARLYLDTLVQRLLAGELV